MLSSSENNLPANWKLSIERETTTVHFWNIKKQFTTKASKQAGSFGHKYSTIIAYLYSWQTSKHKCELLKHLQFGTIKINSRPLQNHLYKLRCNSLLLFSSLDRLCPMAACYFKCMWCSLGLRRGTEGKADGAVSFWQSRQNVASTRGETSLAYAQKFILFNQYPHNTRSQNTKGVGKGYLMADNPASMSNGAHWPADDNGHNPPLFEISGVLKNKFHDPQGDHPSIAAINPNTSSLRNWIFLPQVRAHVRF